MKATEKVYMIDGVEFVRKEKFTLDESDELGRILSVVMSGNDLLGNFNNNFKKFLSMVLIRKDGEAMSDDFNYGKVDEEEAGEIFKAFFFRRLQKAKDLSSSLVS
ncbi:MAG: hypothetical protein PHX51_07170 [Clostridia bacterium]|nr:hypothetical protein [Clostridia bacterium]